MQPGIKFNIRLKTETLLSAAGLAWLLAVFIFQWERLQESSPLVLFIITVAGWLFSFKYKLAGGMFLLFGGLALAVHPFMFLSSLWLIPGAALAGLGGFIILIKWWQQKER